MTATTKSKDTKEESLIRQFWIEYNRQNVVEDISPSRSHAANSFISKAKTMPRSAEDLNALLEIASMYSEVHDFNVIMNALFFGRTRRQGLLMMRRFVEKVADDEIMGSLPAEWQAKMFAVKGWSLENGRAGFEAR